MDQRTNRTFICSVLFLDIVEYSKKPVEEQMGLKERFNALLSEIIKDIAVNDRIILDTGDGAAIGFLGDPEDALFVAMELRDSVQNEQPGSSPPLSIRMGINLGPVKLVMDINKQLNLIGDGINVAQRVMSFSQPKQLLVSRSYFEVISCLSQEYAKLFDYQGLHADKHVREHGIYAVGHYESKQNSVSGVRSRRNIIVETDAAMDKVVEEVRPQPEKSRSTPDQASGHGGATPVPSAVRSLLRKKWLYAAVPLIAIMLVVLFFITAPNRDTSSIVKQVNGFLHNVTAGDYQGAYEQLSEVSKKTYALKDFTNDHKEKHIKFQNFAITEVIINKYDKSRAVAMVSSPFMLYGRETLNLEMIKEGGEWRMVFSRTIFKPNTPSQGESKKKGGYITNFFKKLF